MWTKVLSFTPFLCLSSTTPPKRAVCDASAAAALPGPKAGRLRARQTAHWKILQRCCQRLVRGCVALLNPVFYLRRCFPSGGPGTCTGPSKISSGSSARAAPVLLRRGVTLGLSLIGRGKQCYRLYSTFMDPRANFKRRTWRVKQCWMMHRVCIGMHNPFVVSKINEWENNTTSWQSKT